MNCDKKVATDHPYRALYVAESDIPPKLMLDTRPILSKNEISDVMVELCKAGQMSAVSVIRFESVFSVEPHDKALIEKVTGGRVEKTLARLDFTGKTNE